MKGDREAFLKQVPSSSRGIIKRAFDATAPLSGAIKAKCLDCSGFDRDEVKNCTVVLCPLHPYRPFRPAGEGRQKQRKGPARGLGGPSGAGSDEKVTRMNSG